MSQPPTQGSCKVVKNRIVNRQGRQERQEKQEILVLLSPWHGDLGVLGGSKITLQFACPPTNSLSDCQFGEEVSGNSEHLRRMLVTTFVLNRRLFEIDFCS